MEKSKKFWFSSKKLSKFNQNVNKCSTQKIIGLYNIRDSFFSAIFHSFRFILILGNGWMCKILFESFSDFVFRLKLLLFAFKLSLKLYLQFHACYPFWFMFWSHSQYSMTNIMCAQNTIYSLLSLRFTVIYKRKCCY